MNCKFSDAFRANQWLNIHLLHITIDVVCCASTVCSFVSFLIPFNLFGNWYLYLQFSPAPIFHWIWIEREWIGKEESERSAFKWNKSWFTENSVNTKLCVRRFAYVRCLEAIILFICTIYCEPLAKNGMDTTLGRHFQRWNGNESSLESSFTYYCINNVYTTIAVADSLFIKSIRICRLRALPANPFNKISKISKTSKGWSTLFILANAFFLRIYWFLIPKR